MARHCGAMGRSSKSVTGPTAGILCVSIAVGIGIWYIPRGDVEYRVNSTKEDELGNARVAVRESSIKGAGKGAFALRPFIRGSLVGIYRCQMIPARSMVDGEYAWKVAPDAACPLRCLSLIEGHFLSAPPDFL